MISAEECKLLAEVNGGLHFICLLFLDSNVTNALKALVRIISIEFHNQLNEPFNGNLSNNDTNVSDNKKSLRKLSSSKSANSLLESLLHDVILSLYQRIVFKLRNSNKKNSNDQDRNPMKLGSPKVSFKMNESNYNMEDINKYQLSYVEISNTLRDLFHSYNFSMHSEEIFGLIVFMDSKGLGYVNWDGFYFFSIQLYYSCVDLNGIKEDISRHFDECNHGNINSNIELNLIDDKVIEFYNQELDESISKPANRALCDFDDSLYIRLIDLATKARSMNLAPLSILCHIGGTQGWNIADSILYTLFLKLSGQVTNEGQESFTAHSDDHEDMKLPQFPSIQFDTSIINNYDDEKVNQDSVSPTEQILSNEVTPTDSNCTSPVVEKKDDDNNFITIITDEVGIVNLNDNEGEELKEHMVSDAPMTPFKHDKKTVLSPSVGYNRSYNNSVIIEKVLQLQELDNEHKDEDKMDYDLLSPVDVTIFHSMKDHPQAYTRELFETMLAAMEVYFSLANAIMESHSHDGNGEASSINSNSDNGTVVIHWNVGKLHALGQHIGKSYRMSKEIYSNCNEIFRTELKKCSDEMRRSYIQMIETVDQGTVDASERDQSPQKNESDQRMVDASERDQSPQKNEADNIKLKSEYTMNGRRPRREYSDEHYGQQTEMKRSDDLTTKPDYYSNPPLLARVYARRKAEQMNNQMKRRQDNMKSQELNTPSTPFYTRISVNSKLNVKSSTPTSSKTGRSNHFNLSQSFNNSILLKLNHSIPMDMTPVISQKMSKEASNKRSLSINVDTDMNDIEAIGVNKQDSCDTDSQYHHITTSQSRDYDISASYPSTPTVSTRYNGTKKSIVSNSSRSKSSQINPKIFRSPRALQVHGNKNIFQPESMRWSPTVVKNNHHYNRFQNTSALRAAEKLNIIFDN